MPRGGKRKFPEKHYGVELPFVPHSEKPLAERKAGDLRTVEGLSDRFSEYIRECEENPTPGPAPKSFEMASLSRHEFMPDRMAMLARKKWERQEFSAEELAKLLSIDIEDARDRIETWTAEWVTEKLNEFEKTGKFPER